MDPGGRDPGIQAFHEGADKLGTILVVHGIRHGKAPMPTPKTVYIPPHVPTLFPVGESAQDVHGFLRILIKAVEQSPVSVIITDTKGIIQYVNPKFTQLMGFTAEEAIGKTPRIIKGDFLSREFYKGMWDTILAGNEWHGVFNNRTKSGELVWEVASISPIRDDDGRITHFVGIKEDITEIKRLQNDLEHMARHDQLTGLPNRFLFNDRIQMALLQAKRRGTQCAVMYLDLDEFKVVNDTLGHEAGDAVLVAAGERLQTCIRESDTLARMGGDEFTALLNDVKNRANVERVATCIIDSLTQPIRIGEAECTIGVSVGIALYPQDGTTTDALLSKADHALYEAKHNGRNRFQFASNG
jgi:diguanylate cyclase (GGDEF)-like protein/PAS domain S-box-containing protein